MCFCSSVGFHLPCSLLPSNIPCDLAERKVWKEVKTTTDLVHINLLSTASSHFYIANVCICLYLFIFYVILINCFIYDGNDTFLVCMVISIDGSHVKNTMSMKSILSFGRKTSHPLIFFTRKCNPLSFRSPFPKASKFDICKTHAKISLAIVNHSDA